MFWNIDGALDGWSGLLAVDGHTPNSPTPKRRKLDVEDIVTLTHRQVIYDGGL